MVVNQYTFLLGCGIKFGEVVDRLTFAKRM